MKSIIKTEGNQTFNVPNTDEGRYFIALCAKFLNRPVFEKAVRGRAKNRIKAFKKAKNPFSTKYNRQSYVPVKGSDWLAVYVRPIPDYKKELKERAAAERKALRESAKPRRWNHQKP